MENLLTNNQNSCDNWPCFGSFISTSFSKYQHQEDRNLKTYSPSFCLDLNASYEIDPLFHTEVHVAGLIENGQTLAVFEQNSSGNLNMHTFHFDKGLASIHSQYLNTWLIRDYNYVVSYDASFVAMFNSEELAHERDHRRRRKRGYGLGDKVYISLLVFNLDFENGESSTRGRFYPNCYTLQFDDASTHFWKYKHGYAIAIDGTIIVSTWGVATEILEESECNATALYLNFFKVDSKDCEIKLKHCGQKEIKMCNDPSSNFEDPLIVCNQKMIKIFLRSHNFVYNIDTNLILNLPEDAYENTFWVIDDCHGEVLISLDRSNFSSVNVKVFKECSGEYVKITDFCTSQLLYGNHEPHLHCHGINNGKTCLFIQSIQTTKIMAVNPFSKKVDYVLDIQGNFTDPHVRKVLVTGHQILVLVWDVEREFVLCYNLEKNNRLQSLKNLSAYVSLKHYSFNQIESFGIPKMLVTFLRNNIYHV